MKESALKYVRQNWPVIPLCSPNHSGMSDKHKEVCTASGKAPLLPEWTKRKVPREEEVEQWFNKWPEANVGLILGDTGEHNLVGIDIDGDIGEELLAQHAKGVIPPTLEFKTGKGRRLIYLLPEGAPSKKKAIKGEDGELAFLATGQQTVLPPSVHSNGSVYTWITRPDEMEPAEAPQWLLNIILVQDEEADGGSTPEATVDLDDWNKTITKGERNNHLTKLAGSLIARRNIPKEQIVSFLKTWNEQNCDPPLPEKEIIVMVENLHEAELSKQSAYKGKQEKEQLRPSAFAQYFIEYQKKANVHWRYCVDRGIFYTCDALAGPWKSVDNLYLHREIRKALVEKSESWDTQRHVAEVMYALRELLADPVNDELFDIGLHPDLDHVYVANGILDWRTLELKDWRPDTYSTIQLQAIWDPDAKTSEFYQQWQDVLAEWIPDVETRNFLQEFVGYCLIPDCSHRTAVFLFGPGSNGKSLFLDVISKLFAKYISFVPLHWVGERFESAKLMDKLINVCGDVDNKYMTETSTLKAMIAGDPIRAEFKHGKSFHFHPVSRLMFSANQLPRSSDKSEGWYSRWKFVEFPRRFKTDTKFKRQLLQTFSRPEGLSALLCWAIDGLRRLYNIEEFTVSGDMQQLQEQYRLENDPVVAFHGQLLKPTMHAGQDTMLTISSLYKVFRAWCEDNGVKPVSQHEFTRRLGALDVQKGVRRVRGASTNVFLSLTFNGEGERVGYMDEYLFQESIRASTIRKRATGKQAQQELDEA